MLVGILLMLFGYALGSIPFGLLLAKWRHGLDLRAHGSGGIGAANVAAVIGKRQGLLVLLFDVAKGLVPVAIASSLGLPFEMQVLVGFSAFLGDCFPVWLLFSGGRGVAVLLGVVIVLSPNLFLPQTLVTKIILAIMIFLLMWLNRDRDFGKDKK